MGYFKEQAIENASDEQTSSPWDFMRKQAERYERSLQRTRWMETFEDDRQQAQDEVTAPDRQVS